MSSAWRDEEGGVKAVPVLPCLSSRLDRYPYHAISVLCYYRVIVYYPLIVVLYLPCR